MKMKNFLFTEKETNNNNTDASNLKYDFKSPYSLLF